MLNRNRKKFSIPRRCDGEDIVQNDLSYTPSMMLSMADKGIPISNQSVSSEQFFDGVPMSQGSFEIPLDMQRGVDVADCWQDYHNIRKKAKKGLKDDIAKFGKNPSFEGGSNG